MRKFTIMLGLTAATIASPALAGVGDPIPLGGGATFDLQASARIRYETVDQASIANTADALTARLRLGGEIKYQIVSLLVEGEATGALADDYNDTLPGNGVEPFPVVADPENLELNRAQISIMKDGTGVTIGRQRLNLDNQRFVGAVGWRQNEQTFDAVRGQAKLGKVKLDATYAISQRTIFGVDSPNEHFDGDLVLLNAAYDGARVDASVFSYLLDYDTRAAFSTNTYGLLVQGNLPLGAVTLSGTASYATQSDTGANPVDYSVEYLMLEAGAATRGFSLGAGYELLASDGGAAAFQTPLATLHAFNGWADLFLTTPNAGLQDFYLKAGYTPPSPPVPGLSLAVAWHDYGADFGGADYGSEWNASLGARLGPVAVLVKYADYQADGFGADKSIVWVQAEYSF